MSHLFQKSVTRKVKKHNKGRKELHSLYKRGKEGDLDGKLLDLLVDGLAAGLRALDAEAELEVLLVAVEDVAQPGQLVERAGELLLAGLHLADHARGRQPLQRGELDLRGVVVRPVDAAGAIQQLEIAVAFDPNFGQALVLGPNINASMDPADEPRAQAAVRSAYPAERHWAAWALDGEAWPMTCSYGM